MGYFSQRKKHERANLILNITLTTIAVLTVLSFFDSSISRFFDLLGFWRFHYYIITLAAFTNRPVVSSPRMVTLSCWSIFS